MKTRFILFSAILLHAACLMLARQAQGADANPWHYDLKQAAARAAAENKPLFVVFRCER